MLAVQKSLACATRVRSNRRVFQPRTPASNTYRLPHAVRDRLVSSLAPFRNRDAAFTLAVFLARFWSVPGRVAGSFPIDRRALADHAGLDLTEAQVRGAIRTLEAIGFLDRAIPAPGSLYQPTEEGLRRKPVLFVFGSDYAPSFIAANVRAAAARGRRSGDRRSSPGLSQSSGVYGWLGMTADFARPNRRGPMILNAIAERLKRRSRTTSRAAISRRR
jgi:hypothetical protein